MPRSRPRAATHANALTATGARTSCVATTQWARRTAGAQSASFQAASRRTCAATPRPATTAAVP
eukprot:1709079-Rhodomonas_salina.1